MRNYKKALLSVLVILGVLFSFSITAFAASHSQTIIMDEISGAVTTQPMTFEGNDIILLSNASSWGVIEPESSAHLYQVTLQKRNWWGVWDTVFGRVSLINNGPSSMHWTDTGSGTFRFVFSRPRYDYGTVSVRFQAIDDTEM